jgi:glycosyltransferase involved in cell wall biosynthesis
MKLITIVIPTYNRSGSLAKTLDCLSTQINPLVSSRVEIVISDNASTDSTGELVRQWVGKNNEIDASYFCNSENVGFDHNFILGAKRAKGRFIWFMSDDDFLVEGAVEKVVHILDRNLDVVFAFVNYSMLTPGFDEYFPYRFSGNHILGADEFFVKSKVGFSFVSSCIFKRDIFCELDLNGHIGSYWIQLYAVKDIAQQGNSLIISEPLIKMQRPGLYESRQERKDPRRKIDMFIDYHLSFLDFVGSFKYSRFSIDTVRFLEDLGWADNLNQIVSFKLTSDKYRKNEIKEIFFRMNKFFGDRLVFWLVHVPFLVSPKFLSVIYFYLKLKKIKFKKLIRPIFVRFHYLK